MLNIKWLTHPGGLLSREEFLGDPSSVDSVPGIYGWFFKEIPHAAIDVSGCVHHEGLSLLYVGISPRNETSRENVRQRIAIHYSGTARRSTLRLSLGSLLLRPLALKPRPESGKGKISFGETEKRLSAWMAENAFVVWKAVPEPWKQEVPLIQALDLPLNIDNNRQHPFCETLRAARRNARALA